MMWTKLPLITGITLLLVAGTGPVEGQGVIVENWPIVPPQPHPQPRPIPRPMTSLTIKRLAATARIVNGAAVTRIDQVFSNRLNRPVEGVYLFPLEDDISVSRFSMFMNGKEVSGRILDREEARKTYEAIVARSRDPALLEYVGTRMYQARIFPIPPNGEARIKLEYAQTLAGDNGWMRYRFPLGTAKHADAPIESASIVVEVDSQIPIKSAFCPTHQASVIRSSDTHASASFEASRIKPGHDFVLYYSLSEKEFGLSLLTYREAGQDGFFLARIAPERSSDPRRILPKDICFVVDTSGSMAGDKLAQAKRALKFCLSNLNPQDRFNVVAFSHEPQPFRQGPVPADPENIANALEGIERMRADGGTNINAAVLAALKTDTAVSEETPYLVVLLTDGQPTVGVTDPETILANVQGARPKSARVFVFGIGDDVNTKLLDRLAEENHGTRDYVGNREDLEIKVSSFYRKVSNPVLSGLQLAWGGLSVYDVFPHPLSDLFSGSEVVLTGRYSGVGAKTIELSGSRYGNRQRFAYETNFPAVATAHEFVPRLWAVRKIAYLQDQIRLHGESGELKQTIVKLAQEYGIITDYTAYLVLEEDDRAAQRGDPRLHFAQQIRRNQPLAARAKKAPHAEKAESGGAANRVSLRNNRMAGDAFNAYVLDFDAEENAPTLAPAILRAGNRTFYNTDGRWVDNLYIPDTDTIRIEAYSDEYYRLARRSRGVARTMALGERVVFVMDGRNYEIVPPL